MMRRAALSSELRPLRVPSSAQSATTRSLPRTLFSGYGYALFEGVGPACGFLYLRSDFCPDRRRCGAGGLEKRDANIEIQKRSVELARGFAPG